MVTGFSNAKPLHSVRIASFELSKYEVTFEEYDAFTDATGRERAYDAGWGRGRRPVINVSWEYASGLYTVAVIADGRELSLTERGGVGICGACWLNNAI